MKKTYRPSRQSSFPGMLPLQPLLLAVLLMLAVALSSPASRAADADDKETAAFKIHCENAAKALKEKDYDTVEKEMVLAEASITGIRLPASFYYNRAKMRAKYRNHAGSLADYQQYEKGGGALTDDFYYARGYAELYLRRYDDAVASMRKALELTKDEGEKPWRLYYLGTALYCKGDFEAAIAPWEKFLEVTPASSPAAASNCVSFLWCAKVRMGREPDATLDLKEHLESPKAANLDTWSSHVHYFLVGQVDYLKFLSTAAGSNEGQGARNMSRQLCQAQFFAANRYYAVGDRWHVRYYLRRCMLTYMITMPEYLMARADLDRLEAEEKIKKTLR